MFLCLLLSGPGHVRALPPSLSPSSAPTLARARERTCPLQTPPEDTVPQPLGFGSSAHPPLTRGDGRGPGLASRQLTSGTTLVVPGPIRPRPREAVSGAVAAPRRRTPPGTATSGRGPRALTTRRDKGSGLGADPLGRSRTPPSRPVPLPQEPAVWGRVGRGRCTTSPRQGPTRRRRDSSKPTRPSRTAEHPRGTLGTPLHGEL